MLYLQKAFAKQLKQNHRANIRKNLNASNLQIFLLKTKMFYH